MYPRPFDYRAPETLEEVLDLLWEHGDEAKPLAGGQSLIPLLKLRLVGPALVVDLNRLRGQDRIEPQGDFIEIGPLARHAAAAECASLRHEAGWAAEAARGVGDAQVRNLGTVAGSLAEADPAGDWPSVALALDGFVDVRSRERRRAVPLAEFFLDAYTTALEPQEMVVAVRLRRPRGPSGGAYVKIQRRAGDFAVAGCAACVELASDGRCTRAGIALTGVGPVPAKLGAAESELRGRRLDAGLVSALRRQVEASVEPLGDARGSADYKRQVAGVACERALQRAFAAARRAAGE